jgi:hypothetical protein
MLPLPLFENAPVMKEKAMYVRAVQYNPNELGYAHE